MQPNWYHKDNDRWNYLNKPNLPGLQEWHHLHQFHGLLYLVLRILHHHHLFYHRWRIYSPDDLSYIVRILHGFSRNHLFRIPRSYWLNNLPIILQHLLWLRWLHCILPIYYRCLKDWNLLDNLHLWFCLSNWYWNPNPMSSIYRCWAWVHRYRFDEATGEMKAYHCCISSNIQNYRLNDYSKNRSLHRCWLFR